MMRIWAISDLHTDFEENLQWVRGLSLQDYLSDTLIVAGDISDDMAVLEKTLLLLKQRFAHVFFVPGNHDLWIRRDPVRHSVEKFYKVLNLCAACGVLYRPRRIGGLFILPLFSWYVRPEEGEESLYMEKPGEDSTMKVWMDDYHITWPVFEEKATASEFFLAMNMEHDPRFVREPVLSFSHFLPRRDLILSLKRPVDKEGRPYKDPHPRFNFSRFAGNSHLDLQLRAMGSRFHIYGHQHRNRFRIIDGVTYFSHNLGYRRERAFAGIDDKLYFPKLVWTEDDGFSTYPEN